MDFTKRAVGSARGIHGALDYSFNHNLRPCRYLQVDRLGFDHLQRLSQEPPRDLELIHTDGSFDAAPEDCRRVMPNNKGNLHWLTECAVAPGDIAGIVGRGETAAEQVFAFQFVAIDSGVGYAGIRVPANKEAPGNIFAGVELMMLCNRQQT